jgi:hypothetical protein
MINWKGFGRRQSWLNRDTVQEFSCKDRKATKIVSHDSQWLDRNANEAYPYCKPGALQARELVRCVSNVAAVGCTDLISVFFLNCKILILVRLYLTHIYF